jgi:hypothetical protein
MKYEKSDTPQYLESVAFFILHISYFIFHPSYFILHISYFSKFLYFKESQ